MAAPTLSVPRRIWQSLAAIKTGVILLIVVVVLSAAGRAQPFAAKLEHRYINDAVFSAVANVHFS